jgi:hypothetical protein
MPPARRKTTRKQAPRRSAAKAGDASLKRLNSSLDAAHEALTELRKNLGRGGREVVKDVQGRVTELRKDARNLNKSLRSELGHLQKSIAGARPKASAAKKRASGRKKAAPRPTAAKRSKTATRSKRTASARKR